MADSDNEQFIEYDDDDCPILNDSDCDPNECDDYYLDEYDEKKELQKINAKMISDASLKLNKILSKFGQIQSSLKPSSLVEYEQLKKEYGDLYDYLAVKKIEEYGKEISIVQIPLISATIRIIDGIIVVCEDIFESHADEEKTKKIIEEMRYAERLEREAELKRAKEEKELDNYAPKTCVDHHDNLKKLEHQRKWAELQNYVHSLPNPYPDNHHNVRDLEFERLWEEKFALKNQKTDATPNTNYNLYDLEPTKFDYNLTKNATVGGIITNSVTANMSKPQVIKATQNPEEDTFEKKAKDFLEDLSNDFTEGYKKLSKSLSDSFSSKDKKDKKDNGFDKIKLEFSHADDDSD